MILRDVDATPVAWREGGPADGAPIMFLHGLGGSRTAWDPQLRDLSAAGFRCAAWDMPGYGSSEPLAEPLTFETLAEAAVGWMDALGAPSAHLVGLSLGGMICQHLALGHPGRVRSLALLDTSPAFGFDATTSAATWIEQRLQPMREGATPATIAPRVLRAIMAPAVADDAVAAAVAAMSRVPTAGFAAAARCLVTHDTSARLHEIAVPTLVLVGEHDEETPLSYATRLADAIPGARLERIAGAGHISNLEAPELVNNLLRELLATV